MSQITGSSATPPPDNTLVGNSIEDLDLDVFLDLMLTELQNQDPLNPMENDELLNTISQIREISANDQLSETLESVLLGQNIATATALVGTEVHALADSGRRVSGEVRNVVINNGEPLVELAVTPSGGAGASEGSLEAGDYLYEVVWKNESGVVFSVQVPVSTDQLGDDFKGSVRIEHLPDTGDTPKEIYRTDKSGGGDLRYIGTLNDGQASSFVDTLSDDNRDEDLVLSGARQVLSFADLVEVPLGRIDRVNTIE